MPQITFTKIKDILLIVCIVFMIFFAYKLRNVKLKLENVTELNTSLSDTLIVKKTKEGLFVAKIGLLESYKAKTFIELASKDEAIIKLQKLVTKYEKELKKKGSATVVGTEGAVSGTVVTVVDTLEVYPTYNSTFDFKGWVWGTTKATKDNTSITIQFKEELDVIIGEEKTGFLGWGKRKPFVEVTLHNPYNEVQYLRTYATRDKPEKKFGAGPVVAYGFGELLQPTFFVGFGITYSLIKF